jgi:hypothetical protein
MQRTANSRRRRGPPDGVSGHLIFRNDAQCHNGRAITEDAGDKHNTAAFTNYSEHASRNGEVRGRSLVLGSPLCFGGDVAPLLSSKR